MLFSGRRPQERTPMVQKIIQWWMERAGFAGFFSLVAMLGAGGWLLGIWLDRGLIFRRRRRFRNRPSAHG
jgi:hypothetical protein